MNVLLRDEHYPSREALLQTLELAATTRGAWAEAGVYAVDDRVLWTEEEEGVRIWFAPWDGDPDWMPQA